MPKMVDQGETQVLNVLYGSTSPWSTLYIGLYKNTTEPPETATLANITEVTGTGYSRKALTRGSWTVSGDMATYPQQEWVAESDWGNVYGYFIATSQDNSGHLLFVETLLNAPYVMDSGATLRIVPRVRAS